MGNKLYEETHIQNIANAIREKTGKTDIMKVSQMASEIGGIDTDLSNLSDLVGENVGEAKSDIETAVTGLIDSANATTGNTDTTLTDGVNALIGGYGQGYGGIEDGYDVAFHDENGNILAFISVKQGDSVNAPNYVCKHWQTEDGTKIDFPYIPTGDISLYANNDTYASLLYKHYGVDVGVYPYLTIRFNDSNGATSIIFAKSIASGYYKNVLQCLGGSDNSAPNPSDDLEVFLSYVMGKYTSSNLSTSSDAIFNAFPYMLTNFDLSGMTAYGGGNFDSSVCIRLDIDETEEKLPFDGLENGYDVMFYDENNEGLAFYSIKQGHMINPPVYNCKTWQTEDGTSIAFPYTPTADLIVYANNDTYASQLYDYYGVDSAVYPYLLICESFSSSLSRITLMVIFAKTYTISSSGGNRLKDYKRGVYETTSYTGSPAILTNFSDIEASIATVMKKVKSVADHTDSSGFEMQDFTATTSSWSRYYLNFDNTFSKSEYQRID